MPPALNEPQRRAVQHDRGPLLVLAGPGSGKTRVVTHRIARLLGSGVPASEILAVTFTNKAAKEMRERVRSLTREKARGLTVSTFHSACVRILRAEIEPLGWSKNFSIYDESSQQSLLRAVLRDVAGGGSASGVLQEIGALKSGQAPAPLVAPPADGGEAPAGPLAQEIERRALLGRMMERYQDELRARNAVDFDDIILLTARIFRELPDVLPRWQERWKHVLVDEYQDTNAAQDEILRLLCAEHRNLCVVGDDDQSIYGWRGAEVEHILTFQRRFPESKVVKLEQNYRSTGRIVAVANGLIAKNARRHAKTVFTESGPGELVRVVELPDEKEEADFIAAQIASEIPAGGSAWKEASRFAVLFRTNEQMRPLEQTLRQNKVPYRLIGGRSFFDRKEVLDVLAYLRLAANPEDEEAFYRIANVPSRGLGAGALEALSSRARTMSSSSSSSSSGAQAFSPWAVARLVAAGDPAAASGFSEKARAGLAELVRSIEATEHAAALGAKDLVSDLLARIRYQDEIDRSYKDQGVRVSRWNLALEVQRTWEAYRADASPASLSGLLDAITLRARDDDDDEGGGVTLATIHASKGLEFDVVFVGGLEEGILPHVRSRDDADALAEERRLLYVAVTRARERLVLSRALTRTTRGRAAKTVPSRFLEELPEEALERGLSTAPASAESVSSHVARLRAMLGAGSDPASPESQAAGADRSPAGPR